MTPAPPLPPDNATTDSSKTLAAPARTAVVSFGDYDVIGELGEGGMGRVYKAVDRNLGRLVAIKVLRSADPFECSRFRGEAELIATLEHANIIQIFAIDATHDGRPYLVLEYAEGGSLDRELGGHPQEPRRAAEMMETIARAVQYAHEKGVIHRDLKPANVLRCKDKVLKLTDFGLAKEMEVSSGMTPSNAVMGTPSYMSPEQAEGKTKQLGPPTDVYGLGAILYEMLTGRPPFRGVNMVDTLEQVRWAEPAPPSRLAPRLPRDLSTICLKCLQKSPARRYQTAGELADDLRRWLNGETIAARPAPSWERLARQIRRRPWEAAAITTFALLVALLIFGWVLFVRKSAQEAVLREQAEAEKMLRDQQTKAEREKREAQQANEERLREQARGSLTALNTIRGLVLEGDLSRKPGLEPLYDALSAYYDKLIAQENMGFDKAELADGLVKVGDLFVRTGDKRKARAAYANAANQCRPLAATDPRARETLARALLRAAQVAFDLGEDEPAEVACREVEGLLASLEPAGAAAHPLAASQIAEAHHLRGQLEGRRREFARSEASYDRSIEFRQRLAETVPADLTKARPDERRRAVAVLTDLGRGYGYLGDALLDGGKVTEAERAYWKSHAIRERVAAAFRDDDRGGEAHETRRQLARSWGNFAGLHTRSRALGTARYFAQQSLDAHTKLVELDPINVEYRYDLCNRLANVAELDVLMHLRPGAPPDDRARARIGSDLDKAKELLDDPAFAKERGTRRAQAVSANVLMLRGVLLADAGAREQARDELYKSWKLVDDLCKEQPGVAADPLHLYHRSALRAMFGELGSTADTAEQRRQRLDDLRLAAERLGPGQKHPDDIENFRAFKFLANDPEFKNLMSDLRARAGAKPPTAPAQ
ncbi:MAG: protein kinase domain-containing protein [Gemmata sp.]